MFMKDYAKFTAKIAKGMKVGEDNVEIKLLIPLRVMQENFLFLSSKQEQKVNVFFGDPQAAFDFDEEDDDREIFREVTGRRFMADASGVVSNVEQREEDPNQAKLFNPEDGNGEEQGDQQDGEGGQEGAEVPDAGEDPDNEPGTSDPEEGGEEPPPAPQQRAISEDDDAALMQEMEGGSNDRRLIDQDTPDWMQETGEGGSREQEVQFADGAEAPESNEEQAQGDAASADGQDKGEPAADIDKDILDAFILKERPIFPEVEFDGKPVPFPELLEKRLAGNKTWRDVASENGMSSGQLTTRWSEYKKLVKKKMQGGGGAA